MAAESRQAVRIHKIIRTKKGMQPVCGETSKSSWRQVEAGKVNCSDCLSGRKQRVASA